MPNSVPCAQCTGSWRDEYNGSWSITSDAAGKVTGSLYVDNSSIGCPNQTYNSVSGTLTLHPGSGNANGYSSINISASNPSPGGTPGCVPTLSANMTGDIENDGCDLIPGTATLPTDYGSFTTYFSKSPDIPTGESDVFPSRINSNNAIFILTPMVVGGGSPASRGLPKGKLKWKTQEEALGVRVIEGIETQGMRWVSTLEEQPALVASRERWSSEALGLTLEEKVVGPTWAHTVKLQNLNRSEPDPALFVVPPDYTVKGQ